MIPVSMVLIDIIQVKVYNSVIVLLSVLMYLHFLRLNLNCSDYYKI